MESGTALSLGMEVPTPKREATTPEVAVVHEMDTLFRVFMLRESHEWSHETTLIEYLNRHPSLCGRLGLEMIPDQSAPLNRGRASGWWC